MPKTEKQRYYLKQQKAKNQANRKKNGLTQPGKKIIQSQNNQGK
jgi:hypothetical protein